MYEARIETVMQNLARRDLSQICLLYTSDAADEL